MNYPWMMICFSVAIGLCQRSLLVLNFCSTRTKDTLEWERQKDACECPIGGLLWIGTSKRWYNDATAVKGARLDRALLVRGSSRDTLGLILLLIWPDQKLMLMVILSISLPSSICIASLYGVKLQKVSRLKMLLIFSRIASIASGTA